MKKVLITTLLLLILSGAGFARGNNKNEKLFKELANTLQLANKASFTTSGNFKSTSFSYNGKQIRAFYDTDGDDLIGFSIHLSTADLPANAEANIAKKYSGWAITEVVMFIDTYSKVTYYASVSKPKKPTLALKIGGNNKPYIYARM